MRIVIIGGGPAGQAALALLPDAILVARPAATAWHAEPGLVWIEDSTGVRSLPFDRLLLAADEPLLLMALDCAMAAGRPVVSPHGECSRTGVYAAGAILGADTAAAAALQARIAAQAIAGLVTEGTIAPPPQRDLPADAPRLDPLAVAQLLEQPASATRNAIALAQAGLRGGRLASVIAPARPVGFAALAAQAPAVLTPKPAQDDREALR